MMGACYGILAPIVTDPPLVALITLPVYGPEPGNDVPLTVPVPKDAFLNG